MSIDLSQFIVTFLEESYEGLDIMESSLLDLDSADEETINTIFRAAHSIKGGAGTFGFTEVADFTHVVETLLDEMRSGQQEASAPLVNLLLEAVDCMKALLEATQEGPQADQEVIDDVQDRLQKSLLSAEDEEDESETDSVQVAEKKAQQWQISFVPNSDLLQGGHEPAFMFAALADLGGLETTAVVDNLPNLASLDAEELNISWRFILSSECEEAEIRDIFEWVEDDCQLDITPCDLSDNTRDENVQSASKQGWDIQFVPDKTLLTTGNDPALMFSALAELGELTFTVNTKHLPTIHSLEPDQLFIRWSLQLISDCAHDEVTEIFEWVEDLCQLTVTALSDTEVSAGETEPVRQASQKAEIKTTPETTKTDENSAVSTTSAKARGEKSVKKPASAKKGNAEASSIRVDTDKIDALINRVGELVITQAMLGQIGAELADDAGADVEKLQTGLEQLERNTRDLQEDVMRVRMLPISFVFNRFPRLVHDVSGKLGKKVELVISGEQTEIDKTVMEKIGDPMVHLIRNSLDHGLEEPEERLQAGKSESGTVQLNAYHQGGFVVIDIVDDGRGLNTEKIYQKALEKGLISADQQLNDDEINELVFKPGFSTADVVSDLSGRGVGMDVVRRNIESLGGNVSVKSERGKGSSFSVKLPLTLAILEGQLVRVHQETYIIPLVSIVETILAAPGSLSSIAGESRLLQFREEYIPLINLKTLFQLPSQTEASAPLENRLIAIVEHGGKKVGLIVDELYGQQQVVIKSLEVNFKRIEGFSGATILGNGGVALILDVAGLIQRGLSAELNGATEQQNQRFTREQTQGNVA